MLQSDKQLNKIVGLGVGLTFLFLFLIALAILVFFFIKRRKDKQRDKLKEETELVNSLFSIFLILLKSNNIFSRKRAKLINFLQDLVSFIISKKKMK